MVTRLESAARACGRGFGVKFSNTLVVENPGDFLPKAEKLAYLSGAPLHVISGEEEAALNFRRNIGVGGIVDGAMPSQSKQDEHLPKLHIQTLTEGDSRVIRRAPVVYCGHGSGCNCGGIQP